MASVTNDSSRITKLLKESVVLLCENSLGFTAELHIQALLAITVDRSTIFAVQLDEKVVKAGESADSGVTSGSSGKQGQALPQQRPAVARRLALPGPTFSPAAAGHPGGDDGVAWQPPQAVRGMRTRGPRFPVGRGRGMSRGASRGGQVGRGGASMRGVRPAMRMIRTAVSSVRFPVSRPRMQGMQRAARLVAARPPIQRLALPAPPTGTGSSPRQMMLAAVRQRTPAPMRQAAPTLVRKPSPRLAIMPPGQMSFPGGTPPGVRQQSPSVVPRKPVPVRAVSTPRGVGRPRLAILPRSPNQPGATAPRRSSTMLALMPPPPQSPVKSLSNTRQQGLAVQQQTPPSTFRLQTAARQPSPRQLTAALVKREASLPFPPQLAQLANQLSSSSVGTQLHAVVEQFSNQQRQSTKPGVAVQSSPVVVPLTKSAPVTPTTPAAKPRPIVVSLNSNQAVHSPCFPATAAAAGMQSPRPSTILTVRQLLSPAQSSPSVVGTTAAITHQTVAMTSAAMSRAYSAGSVHPSPQQFQPTTRSAVPNTLADTVGQNIGMTGTRMLGTSNLGVTTQQVNRSSDMMNTFLLSADGPFSPTQLRPTPSHPLTALPLYAPSSPSITAIPQSPFGRTEQWQAMPGSPFGLNRATPGNGSVMAAQGQTVAQLLRTPSKQLVLSPQPHLPQYFASPRQQHPASPFSPQPQQAPSSPAQTYLLSSVLTDDASRNSQQFLSPLKTPTMSPAMMQQRGQSSPQVPARTQNQFADAYFQQMTHSPRPTASNPTGAIQQMMTKPRAATASPQGQAVSSQVPNWTQNLSRVALPSPATMSVQQQSENVRGASQMQKMTHVNPMMLYSQQTAVPSPTHASPLPIQRHARVPQSPSSQRVLTEVDSYQPQHQVSTSQAAQQAMSTKPAVTGQPRPVLVPLPSPSHASPAPLQRIQQTAVPSARHMSPVAVPRAAPSSSHASLPVQRHAQVPQSPSSQRMSGEVGSRQPQNQMSISQAVAQAAMSGSEFDRHAVLEIIKQQAYEQIRQAKQPPTGAQPSAVPTTSDGQQTAPPGTVVVHGRPTQPATTAVNPTLQRQTSMVVTGQSGAVASSSDQLQPHVSEPVTPQQTTRVSTGSAGDESTLLDGSVSLQSSCTTSSTATPTSNASVSDTGGPDVNTLSTISESDAISIDVNTGTQPGTSVTKQKLLQLKEKVEKKGSVEFERQKIIASELQKLETDVDVKADVDDRSSVVCGSSSITSVTRIFESGRLTLCCVVTLWCVLFAGNITVTVSTRV